MSTFKRNIRHQHIARQDPPGGITLVPEPSKSSSQPQQPPPPSTTKESSSTRPRGPTVTRETETTKETTTERETTKEQTETETSTKSESTSVSSNTGRSSSSTGTGTLPRTAPTLSLPTGGGILPSLSLTNDLTPSISPSTTALAQTGAINTGVIVGGIAGGIAGIALLGIIISFFLRRWRNRRREEEFNASQFRRSAMIMDGSEADNDPRPMSLFGGRWGGFGGGAERNSVAGAGSGMAGAGAWRQDAGPEPEMQQYQDYQSPTTAAGPLQPRQQYTYGESYDNAAAQNDDMTHGAYSEQPQQTAVYNLEAYGDYAAYAGHNNAGGHKQHESDAYGGI